MILNLNVGRQQPQLIRENFTLSPRLIMPLENGHVLKAKGLCVCVYACMYIQAIRKHMYNS